MFVVYSILFCTNIIFVISGIFLDCHLREAIDDSSISFPDPEPLPYDTDDTPFYILGDDAFPLREWLMKPYGSRTLTKEERILNYRLSRARRVVENAFGILSARFRFLHTSMLQTTANAIKLIQVAVLLHNMIRSRYRNLHLGWIDREDSETHAIIPGRWRTDQVLRDVLGVRASNTATKRGKQIREALKHYVNYVHKLPWQENRIESHY